MLESYPVQDKMKQATIEDGVVTLRLHGDTWKRIAYPTVIGPDSVIEFDYLRDQMGEIHGVGFGIGQPMSDPLGHLIRVAASACVSFCRSAGIALPPGGERCERCRAPFNSRSLHSARAPLKSHW